MPAFGRIEPPNRDHETKYAFKTLHIPIPTANVVEVSLPISESLRRYYDQKDKPECVGFAQSQMVSIYNREILYDPHWLYREAQKIDGVAEPHDGTSTVAGLTVLYNQGHKKVLEKYPHKPDGTKNFYWIKTAVELRTALALGRMVVCGFPWPESFMYPSKRWNGWYVDDAWGEILGGHEILFNAWSDKRGCAQTPNSWGGERKWHKVWFKDAVIDKLIEMGGEMAVVIDLPTRT